MMSNYLKRLSVNHLAVLLCKILTLEMLISNTLFFHFRTCSAARVQFASSPDAWKSPWSTPSLPPAERYLPTCCPPMMLLFAVDSRHVMFDLVYIDSRRFRYSIVVCI